MKKQVLRTSKLPLNHFTDNKSDRSHIRNNRRTSPFFFGIQYSRNWLPIYHTAFGYSHATRRHLQLLGQLLIKLPSLSNYSSAPLRSPISLALAFIVQAKGIQPGDAKVGSVEDATHLANASKARFFLGFTNSLLALHSRP